MIFLTSAAFTEVIKYAMMSHEDTNSNAKWLKIDFFNCICIQTSLCISITFFIQVPHVLVLRWQKGEYVKSMFWLQFFKTVVRILLLWPSPLTTSIRTWRINTVIKPAFTYDPMPVHILSTCKIHCHLLKGFCTKILYAFCLPPYD